MRVVLDDSANNGGNIATVKRRATDYEGRPLGAAHKLAALDTREYEVELEDGTTDRIMANKIAANIYSQLDDEGREILAFGDITDHRTNKHAIPLEEGFYETRQGNKKPKKTTRGWEVLVEWKDGNSTWMDMKDVKEANPVELAEYAVANKIEKQPAFAWWVPYTLKKRERIINKVKTKYWKTTHKYGVRLPKTVDEALDIDGRTGTNFWREALNKEMHKAKVAYEERCLAAPPIKYDMAKSLSSMGFRKSNAT